MNCCAQCRGRSLAYYGPRRARRTLRGLGQTDIIPSGSQLNYSTSYSPAAGIKTLDTVVAAVKQNLQSQWNIVVTGSQYPGFGSQFISAGPFPISLQLQTMADYGQLSDIQSIVDGAWYNVAGGVVTGSKIAITGLASGGTIGTNIPVPPPPPSGFDLASFLSDNWMWIAVALAGAAVLEDVL